jgi:hypothetical protein
MRVRSGLYRGEQHEIFHKILRISDLDDDKSFKLSDIDEDVDKQQHILALIPKNSQVLCIQQDSRCRKST